MSMRAALAVAMLVAGVIDDAVAQPALPAQVLIDPSDQYAMTLMSISRRTSTSELDKLNARLASRKGARIVSWDTFSKEVGHEIRQFIRRNDYPDVNLATAIPQVLMRYEGTPIGITWNGGLAITGNDYRHAAKAFAAYSADPPSTAAGTNAPVTDRRRDPVHPANHLEALLYRQ